MNCERLFTDEEHVLVKFFCAAHNNRLASLLAWFLWIRSDTHRSQIDSVKTNLTNEIALPA